MRFYQNVTFRFISFRVLTVEFIENQDLNLETHLLMLGICTLYFYISVLKPENTEIIPTGISTSGCCQIAKAIDKDISTRAEISFDEVAADKVAPEAWLKVEFGKVKFIHKVTVYFRFYTDWYRPFVDCAKNVEKFKECVDKENNVELLVLQDENVRKICGTFQRTYGPEQSDQIYTLVCNTEGDSVELRKRTGALRIFEVVVTGKGNIYR